jgi:hypothetical protein
VGEAVSKIVVLGAGHWHLPLYRDARARELHVVSAWDADAAQMPGICATGQRHPVGRCDIKHGQVTGLLGFSCAHAEDAARPARLWRNARPVQWQITAARWRLERGQP